MMKVSDLNFTVDLKSTYTGRSNFPSDDVVGLTLTRPDAKRNTFRLKLTIPEAACKKSQLKPGGFIMAQISDCSNGMKLLYEEEQGVNFKGYTLRPLGGYKNKEQIEAYQKQKGTPWMSLYVEINIPFELLDTQRTQKFPIKYCKIIAAGKHNMVIDISHSIPIFVKKK